ncbi:tyrosine-type recombinase/integrase [Mycetocola zhadangensis]|uniref:Site-specific integrase n=1 Tax=Mycetocola zhadangensis TaxID=1164595 RepID=A0A3L7J6F9_9MICO|nr:site-specific integrase [Mycetocola zhadangensis]RLQ86186.1 site-specific integrase [Mycetocola zhadangensis]GGE89114.1 putative prophage phiRv2 integrase [Mycetocola zhadangensis]
MPAAKKNPKELAFASVQTRTAASGATKFVVRYTDPGKKQRSISFDGQMAAEEFASRTRRVGSEKAMQMLLSETAAGTTFAEYAWGAIDIRRGVIGQKSIDDYSYWMRSSIPDAFGFMLLGDVTQDDVQQWVLGLSEAGLAEKTMKNRHGFVSMVFKQAYDGGEIRINPCKETVIPRTVSREMEWLTLDEFSRIVAFIPDHYKALVRTMAFTGLRWGEVTCLTKGDVNRETGLISVNKAWVKDRMATGGLRIGPPKTKRGKRHVRLPPEILKALMTLLESGSRRDLLFTKKNGEAIRQQYFWQWVWVPARNLANGRPAFNYRGKAAGGVYKPREGYDWDKSPIDADIAIGKEIRIHDLRHTFASWMLAEGVAMDVLQRLLGHESITTTVDRYSHMAPERINASAAAGSRIIAEMSDFVTAPYGSLSSPGSSEEDVQTNDGGPAVSRRTGANDSRHSPRVLAARLVEIEGTMCGVEAD